jgi:MFS family permease
VHALASFGTTMVIAILLVISVAGLLGYGYISWKTLNPRQPYEEKRKYAFIGGVLIFLSCLGLSAAALIRQPVLTLVPVFLLISLAVGGLAGQTILSPAWLASFWGKRIKRNDHLSHRSSKTDSDERTGSGKDIEPKS